MTHQWAVVLNHIRIVLPLPAGTTEVFKTSKIATEVRALLDAASGAKRVLQVRIHLDLLGELGSLDLDERSSHGLHVRAIVVKRHATGSDWILEFIRVDARIQDATKEVVHNMRQSFSVEHSMQGANEDSFLRVKTLSWRSDVVAIAQHPGNNLHLLGAHATRRYLVVPASTVAVVMGTSLQQGLDVLLVVKNYVDVALWWIGHVVLTGPFNFDRAELFESVGERYFSNVPRNAAQKHLAGISSVLVSARWQMTAPSACRLAQRSSIPVHASCSLQVAVAVCRARRRIERA